MAEFEVPQTDVVIRLVHLGTDRKLLDDIPHHLERFAEIAGVVETDPQLQSRFSPLLFAGVFLDGGGFEVNASAVVDPLAFQEVVAELQVGVKAQAAARIALDDRLPDLDGLGGLVGIEASIARFDQLLRGPIFHDRTSHRGGAGFFHRGCGSLGQERSANEQNQQTRECLSHHKPPPKEWFSPNPLGYRIRPR